MNTTNNDKANASKTTNCGRETLAVSTLCGIELCSCGTIHVNIGPFTLRLLPAAMADIAATFDDARRAYLQRTKSPGGDIVGLFGAPTAGVCSS